MTDKVTRLNQKKFIFVIEDSEDFQFLLTQLLEGDGYRVECARNGKDALEKLRVMPDLPSLVLLDLMMPIMDGYQFKIQIDKEERFNQLPIVLMTAHGDIQASKQTLGARDALRKPIDMNQVLDVVKAQTHA